MIDGKQSDKAITPVENCGEYCCCSDGVVFFRISVGSMILVLELSMIHTKDLGKGMGWDGRCGWF